MCGIGCYVIDHVEGGQLPPAVRNQTENQKEQPDSDSEEKDTVAIQKVSHHFFPLFLFNPAFALNG